MANGRARCRPGCAQHTLMLVALKRNTPGPKGQNPYPGESTQEPDEPSFLKLQNCVVFPRGVPGVKSNLWSIRRVCHVGGSGRR